MRIAASVGKPFASLIFPISLHISLMSSWLTLTRWAATRLVFLCIPDLAGLGMLAAFSTLRRPLLPVLLWLSPTCTPRFGAADFCPLFPGLETSVYNLCMADTYWQSLHFSLSLQHSPTFFSPVSSNISFPWHPLDFSTCSCTASFHRISTLMGWYSFITSRLLCLLFLLQVFLEQSGCCWWRTQ